MSKINRRPNYAALFPGVEISPEILNFLQKSDMRMEYEESHRKRERVVRDENGNIVAVLPSFEDSLDRLIEAEKQFPDETPTPEQMFLEDAESDALHRCIALLSEDERLLVIALFFDGLSEREYADVSGLSKSAVNRHRQKILEKLKNLLLNLRF